MEETFETNWKLLDIRHTQLIFKHAISMDFYFKSLQIKSIYIPYAQNDYVYYVGTVDNGVYRL